MLETITAVNQAVNSFIWASRRWSASSAWACCSVCGQAFCSSGNSPMPSNDHRPHLPQKGRLRRRDDSVPGSVYGAGRYRRHRQHRRRGGRDRHRRAGCGVLDVVLGSAGHVYQILRSDAGRAFPRAEQKRRAGGRPMYYIKTASAAGGSSSRCCTRCSAC